MKTEKVQLCRKFILREEPSSLKLMKLVDREIGYLPSNLFYSVQIRREGEDYFISTSKKKGNSFLSKESALTKIQFEILWPSTQGKRLHMKRYFFPWKELEIIIDIFQGGHAPLALAEILFPTLAASKSFEKPFFLGEEITDHKEYEKDSLAFYGVPEEINLCQVGVMPYIIRDHSLHILLITSSSGNRWILPKGRQEPDMTPQEVAMMEAVEEAGIIGTLHEELQVRSRTTSGRLLQLYAMKISKLLGNWPEEHFRLRRLLPLPDALKMIDDPHVIKAIKRLALQLKK